MLENGGQRVRSLSSTLVLLFVLLGGHLAIAEAEQPRFALVIGNNNYDQVPLKNPANDAADIADILNRRFGFGVTQLLNGTHKDMSLQLDKFADSLPPDSIALFYFAGHGVQIKERNYLIPTDDEQIKSEKDVEFHALEANEALAKLDASKSSMNIIILDACRNNPFRGFRSPKRGLAPLKITKGTFVAYSAAPGQVASDGAYGERNSPFAKHLLALIDRPLKIEDVFKEVRRKVSDETGGVQLPWASTSLTGKDLYLAVKATILNKDCHDTDFYMFGHCCPK